MYWGMSGSESGVAHIIIHMNYDQENMSNKFYDTTTLCWTNTITG